MRAEQKSLSKELPRASAEDKPALLERTKALSAKVKDVEASANEARAEFDRLAQIPSNVIEPGVVAGGEDDYVVLREVGERPQPDPVRDHLDLAEGLRAMDLQRGAKGSAARVCFPTGCAA